MSEPAGVRVQSKCENVAQVGRSLPRAQNDTSVAFRSKAITLPGQSVAADRAGAAVSSHNLTLKVNSVQHVAGYTPNVVTQQAQQVSVRRSACRELVEISTHLTLGHRHQPHCSGMPQALIGTFSIFPALPAGAAGAGGALQRAHARVGAGGPCRPAVAAPWAGDHLRSPSPAVIVPCGYSVLIHIRTNPSADLEPDSPVARCLIS